MKKPSFLPILLGSDENAYGCARLFYDEYKIKPLLLCARALPPTSHSKILNRKVIKDLDTECVFREILTELLPLLKKEADELLLIPCSDYYTDLTVKNRALILSYSKTPINTESLHKKINGKEAFYALCREKGLPFPDTVIMSPGELLNAPLPFDLPLVIKPINSNSFSYLHLNIEGKKKVWFCRDEREVRELAKALSSVFYTERLIVQRFIEGKKALTVNAYCDKAGRVRLIGAAEPILQYTAPSLIGNYAALKTVSARKECGQIIRFLEETGYTGFVNFDLMYDKRSEEYLFLELNPRQGRSSYYMHSAGANLMKALVDDVICEKEYKGVDFAENEAVWSNIPPWLLKSLTDVPLPEKTRPDSAVSLFFDVSPARFFTLIKRDAGAYKIFKSEETEASDGQKA